MKNLLCISLLLLMVTITKADVGDPQVQTDHDWYPGELACSTFDRLFATQARQYTLATGRPVLTDEDKALASWFWRNTHYWHGEEGGQNLWNQGFGKGVDTKEREYWTGLFAHGFALCGTTHSQWVAEMEALFGHGRARSVGTAGHNSFEVFLRGGEYGTGRWALLDHDLSTVVFAPDRKRLLGIGEIAPNWKQLSDRAFNPERQRGWLPAGLHPGDAASFSAYGVAEYLSGYAGPPPRVHLRAGETLRRYIQPGLADGKTFVFWGRNYNTKGIPGPERSRTWVNQPEKMFRSKNGTPHIDGQARYANAVYEYRPNFQDGRYREGIVNDSDSQVTFTFQTPYIIAATPANNEAWSIYDRGSKNGLVLQGDVKTKVSVSVDRGTTWIDCGMFQNGLDLTDYVKGHRQYWLKLHTSADKLIGSNLLMTTVCQCNSSIIPRLKSNGSEVQYESTGLATVSAGPNLAQAAAHMVDGQFNTPRVTLKFSTPHGEPIRQITAAAHVKSSSPPDPKILYWVEYSVNEGKTWLPLVKDWNINRQGDEPNDFWSQSLCWGTVEVYGKESKVLVRFRNNGGKAYARAELHLTYPTTSASATRVTFCWTDSTGEKTHSFLASGRQATWKVPTGANAVTKWVEYRVE